MHGDARLQHETPTARVYERANRLALRPCGLEANHVQAGSASHYE